MTLSRLALILGLVASLGMSAFGDESKVEIIRDRTYIERDSGPLHLDLYLPKGKGPFPGVLVVHGGAWRIGSKTQLAAVAMSMAKNGYSTAAISYRLAPQDKFPAQIYDCQAAVRWMRTHATELKLDPSRIGGLGYSAGGHLVALLGTLDDDDFREEGVPADAPSARLQAVMAGGAPCDFRMLPANSSGLAYWLGGTLAEKSDLYRIASPASFITPDDPPMFFFHGQTDMIVPVGSPKRMVEQLASAGVPSEFFMIKNSGHILAMFDVPALKQSLAFADKHLKPLAQAAGDAVAPPTTVTEQPDAADAATPPAATAPTPLDGGGNDQ